MATDTSGTDISATLTIANTFTSQNAANNGSVVDDVRVNLISGNSTQLTLALFDAATGLAYDADGNDFEWSLVFYDIDGLNANASGRNRNLISYDQVLLRTEGTVTVAEESILNIQSVADGLLIDAANVANLNVQGENGLETLTAEQEPISFVYTLSNTSSASFDDTVVGNVSQPGAGYQRNLLVDGGELSTTFSGETAPVAVAPVPLPPTAALVLTGFGALALTRRRK